MLHQRRLGLRTDVVRPTSMPLGQEVALLSPWLFPPGFHQGPMVLEAPAQTQHVHGSSDRPVGGPKILGSHSLMSSRGDQELEWPGNGREGQGSLNRRENMKKEGMERGYEKAVMSFLWVCGTTCHVGLLTPDLFWLL